MPWLWSSFWVTKTQDLLSIVRISSRRPTGGRMNESEESAYNQKKERQNEVKMGGVKKSGCTPYWKLDHCQFSIERTDWVGFSRTRAQWSMGRSRRKEQRRGKNDVENWVNQIAWRRVRDAVRGRISQCYDDSEAVKDGLLSSGWTKSF